jgi:hypothetical protein
MEIYVIKCSHIAPFITYLSRSSPTHVVGAPAAVKELVVEFDQTGEKEHLGLTPSRDGVPSFESLGWEGSESSSVGKVSREIESGADSPPSNESSHGNTAMLDFRMTEP